MPIVATWIIGNWEKSIACAIASAPADPQGKTAEIHVDVLSKRFARAPFLDALLVKLL